MTSNDETGTAEQRLREAFQRLKDNKPKLLPTGAKVNKTNIALEAGYEDPSSFRAERFQTLVWEIKAYKEMVANAQPSPYRRKKQKQIERISSEKMIAEVKRQRDVAQSQLLSIRRAHLEVLEENKRLLEQGASVVNFPRL